MSIYSYLDYRKAIKFRVNSLKKSQGSISMSKMATAIRVQAPYISKVMNNQADFNDDQLYLACNYLSFNEDEKEYLSLLLDYERSSLIERKNKLLIKIEAIQKEKLDTTSHIDSNKLNTETSDTINYYLDPIHLIVHMYLSMDEYNQDIKLLAKKLNLSQNRIEKIIDGLLKMGIIRLEDGKFKKNVINLHLPKSSTICGPHQQLLRQLCISHFQNNDEKDTNYNLAITYTGDEESRKKIQTKFLDFLKEADKIIDKAPSREVYQMNFDLFGWGN